MFGIYIHFPFCRKRCPFCDFAIAVRREIPHDRYADCVLAELEARAPLFAGRRAVSIYFGGGTPGLWRPDCVERVIAACQRRFGAAQEITVECIPGELSAEHARALRAAGVNRLSIGLEALDNGSLGVLGRWHTAAQAREAVAHARAAGITNLSGDLMFARPGQTLFDWRKELAAAQALDLPHWSLYQLTIEPRTPFHRFGLQTLDGTDDFLAAHDVMTSHGYVHYEISSYARPGFVAVHNSLYWSGGEYLGLGMSAHSFRRVGAGGERWANPREIIPYLREPAAPPPEREVLSSEKLRREALWLGLRRLDVGVPAESFADWQPEIRRLVREGLVEVGDRVRLTRRGMLLADEVALRFL